MIYTGREFRFFPGLLDIQVFRIDCEPKTA